jgi:hypothetical protein
MADGVPGNRSARRQHEPSARPSTASRRAAVVGAGDGVHVGVGPERLGCRRPVRMASNLYVVRDYRIYELRDDGLLPGR